MLDTQRGHFLRTQAEAERRVEKDDVSLDVCLLLHHVGDVGQFPFAQYFSLTFSYRITPECLVNVALLQQASISCSPLSLAYLRGGSGSHNVY